MAYIERFVVTGLAGRSEPVERVLDRHVNIFWGLNGTGKTSLLKILTAALSNDVKSLRRVPFESAEVIFWSTDYQARIRRSVTRENIDFDSTDNDDPFASGTQLQPVGDGLWQEVEMPARVASWASELLEGEFPAEVTLQSGRVRKTGLGSSFSHSYMPISRLTQVRNNGRYGPVVDDDFLDQDFAEQVRGRWQSYNSEALAKIRSIQQQGLAVILALLFGGGSGEENNVARESVSAKQAYTIVSNFLREQRISLRFGESGFVSRYEDNSDLQSVVSAIEDVTREVEVALRPQHEFQNTIERLYSGGKRLRLESNAALPRATLRVEVEGTLIPLPSLSSGEKQLLRLMLETLAADESTVMIDEPELSMHVDWQQVLVASMRRVNPHCQLLLATHSPEVMADVSDENVFEL